MGDDGGTETAFHERLRGALRASKLGKKELAGKAGISRQHLYDVEQGRSGITVIAASRLAGALGTTVGQLLGESPLAAPSVPREALEQAERLARDAAELAEAARKMSDLMSGPVQAPAPLAEVIPFPVPAGDPRFFDIRAVEELDRLHRDEVVEVPRVAARVAAGPGTLPDPTESTPTYTFRVGFMRRVGWNPEKPNWGRFACVLMHQSDAIAGSMVPTIHPRSLVLVRRDPITDASQLRRRAICLVDIPASAGDAEHGLAIKRVTVETGFLRLESDAPGHPEITVPLNEETPLHTVVRGKVVWWSVEADQAE